MADGCLAMSEGGERKIPGLPRQVYAGISVTPVENQGLPLWRLLASLLKLVEIINILDLATWEPCAGNF